MSVINSHDNWSPLEEVWLGDVYPVDWYEHLPNEICDCFQELTERTQQDLQFIQKKLESMGVVVRRPCYDSIDNYIDPQTQQLSKPEICPRDNCVTIGQTLFAKKNPSQSNPWQQHIDHYESQGAKVDYRLEHEHLSLGGASIVRAGRDLYFDLPDQNFDKSFLLNCFRENFAEKFQDYRVHVLINGGHVDACFSLLKPGLILGSRYFKSYDLTFPGWQLINVARPEFFDHRRIHKSKFPQYNGKWWLPKFSYSRSFNSYIIEHAKTWIGDYTETFFEVNCLVLDPQNILIPGENEAVFRALENLGITAHSVPFRTRTFWDGGMHCITLDIRRRGNCEDLFPDRGKPKITTYD